MSISTGYVLDRIPSPCYEVEAGIAQLGGRAVTELPLGEEGQLRVPFPELLLKIPPDVYDHCFSAYVGVGQDAVQLATVSRCVRSIQLSSLLKQAEYHGYQQLGSNHLTDPAVASLHEYEPLLFLRAIDAVMAFLQENGALKREYDAAGQNPSQIFNTIRTLGADKKADCFNADQNLEELMWRFIKIDRYLVAEQRKLLNKKLYIQIFLLLGASPKAIDSNRSTLLMMACSDNNLELIKFFLDLKDEMGAPLFSVNDTDSFGCNILHFVSSKEALQLIVDKYSVDGHPSPFINLVNNTDNIDNRPPLVQVIRRARYINDASELVEALISIGARADDYQSRGKNNNLLMIGTVNEKILAVLIEDMKKRGVKVADLVKAKNKNGYTPLMFAAMHANVESAKLLLEEGATIFSPEDVPNKNVLRIAASKNAGKICDFFIEKIIELEVPPACVIENKFMVLNMFRSCNLPSMRWFLKEFDMNSKYRLANDDTYIRKMGMESAETNNLFMFAKTGPVVDLLAEIIKRKGLDVGTFVNETNVRGQTPLMRMARLGNLEGLKALIKHGARVGERDSKGLSALAYANKRYLRDPDIQEALKNCGLVEGDADRKRSPSEEYTYFPEPCKSDFFDS